VLAARFYLPKTTNPWSNFTFIQSNFSWAPNFWPVAEVSDPLLRQDYDQGIATLDPGSDKLSMSESELTQQRTLRQLVEELKPAGLEKSRHDEILNFILANIG
jgi:hypothetical protein